ncbi:major royal jelly domain-containing protein [Trichoderma sp. SZMC 28012]
MKSSFVIPWTLWSISAVIGQEILSDPGTLGPALETIHLFYDQWPTGFTVSSSGRIFVNYPPVFPNSINFTVGEIVNGREVPYPNLEINTPPGGRLNYSTNPPTSSNSEDHLIGVISVITDTEDRLWILDSGRVASTGGLAETAYGGPKLIGMHLTNNTIFKKILFDQTAVPADGYLNDVRIDLNPALTPSGQGVAYLSDNSPEGRTAIVVVDLGSGATSRKLVGDPSISSHPGFVPFIWGEAVYSNSSGISHFSVGVDGIALSADGSTLYYCPAGGRSLYGIETKYLLDNSHNSDVLSKSQIQVLGDKGLSDGLETDSNNNIYGGNMEDNSIIKFNPKTGLVQPFVRDPRLSWTDTLSVATDGYLYFTENQLWRAPIYWGGIDRRVKPYAMFRVKLPDGGVKVSRPRQE